MYPKVLGVVLCVPQVVHVDTICVDTAQDCTYRAHIINTGRKIALGRGVRRGVGSCGMRDFIRASGLFTWVGKRRGKSGEETGKS
jgi:hypothetical protein